jgi:hypothetical protein
MIRRQAFLVIPATLFSGLLAFLMVTCGFLR